MKGKYLGIATAINDPFATEDGWIDEEDREGVLNCLPSKVFESKSVNVHGGQLVYLKNLKDTMYPAYLVIEKP